MGGITEATGTLYSGKNVKSHKSDFRFNNSFPIGKTFYQREADYCSLAHPQSWSFGYVSSMDSTCADPYAHGNRLPIDDGYGHKKQILRFTERLTYACATNVYPNSQKMCDIICSMGIGNPKKMLVIGNGGSNGIDTAFYSRNATQDIKISTFDFTFGFVGRIFYEKGINELVASFIRLQKDYPNIGLRLIGFMEENLYPVDDWVKQEISTNSHIEFVGFQQDVRPYLMGCEAFVFPSYREGFPNVVMQAGALELPQIVTDINGCNEIIVQNKME